MKLFGVSMIIIYLNVLLLMSCSTLATRGVLSGNTLDELMIETGKFKADTHRQPVVAIALGGGGMRGYAHIGVLQALEESGITPDIVVGTSVGAIVGAVFASGVTPTQLWEKADTAKVNSLADLTLCGPGFVKGEALALWIDSLVSNVPIEHFPKKFAAVASDLDRSSPIVLTKGDAGQAVRASAAIPGVFLPVRYQKGELVDGGVTSVVPIRTARAMGADIVIGVDIYCHGPQYRTSSIASTVLRVTQAQSCLLAYNELAEADFVISPDVSPAGVDDAVGRERARRAGYDAAKSVMPQLQIILDRKPSTPEVRKLQDPEVVTR